MFFYWSKSLVVRMEMVDDLKADLKKAKERTSHVFEVEDQISIYTRSSGV